MAKTTTISLDKLHDLTERSLRALGLNEAQREAVCDVLHYAELRGKSQGLVKIVERTVVPRPGYGPLEVEHKSGVCARILARGENGMLTMQRAADLAAEMAQEHGLGLVAAVGTDTSTGSIGYYAKRIAEQGLFGLMMVGSPKSLALHGGKTPVAGANPIAFACPSKNRPVVVDVSSTATTFFDVVKAAKAGEQLAPDVAYDRDGQPTTDPHEAMKGALIAFAGHKGAALAFMVEALTGPLTGASITGDKEDSRGNFVVAIKPDLFDEDAPQRTEQMIERMRASGASLPGDRGNARATEILASNAIAVETHILNALQAIADGAKD